MSPWSDIEFIFLNGVTKNKEIGYGDNEFCFVEKEKNKMEYDNNKNEDKNKNKEIYTQHEAQQHPSQQHSQLHSLQHSHELLTNYVFNSFRFFNEEIKDTDEQWKIANATTATCDIKNYVENGRKTIFLNINGDDLSSIFKCFFCKNMIKTFVDETNKKGHKREKILEIEKERDEDKNREKYKFKRVDVDEVEMYAFVAVLTYWWL